ncbi:SRR1-like domain [Dillenia turbinata]|uniref:SRR1-like domain n=1 Tax=Dillenia turbinata TaxID=194707 RepID=A0AAN8V7A5_9MAGN
MQEPTPWTNSIIPLIYWNCNSDVLARKAHQTFEKRKQKVDASAFAAAAGGAGAGGGAAVEDQAALMAGEVLCENLHQLVDVDADGAVDTVAEVVEAAVVVVAEVGGGVAVAVAVAVAERDWLRKQKVDTSSFAAAAAGGAGAGAGAGAGGGVVVEDQVALVAGEVLCENLRQLVDVDVDGAVDTSWNPDLTILICFVCLQAVHGCSLHEQPLPRIKTLSSEKPTLAEEWTVVLPRGRKQRRYFPKIETTPEQKQPQTWAPVDIEINPKRELKIMQRMQNSIKKLESSQFYHSFLDQVQTLDGFLRVLGSESAMQVVIYGIGNIEGSESSRLQLSLVILLKRRFSWIGKVEAFDPVLSATECRVLEALGCTVLMVNEHGRRQALKPTLFFMPHCEAELYDNLLQANWEAKLLNNVVLFGNSFQVYEQIVLDFKPPNIVNSSKHIMAVQRFTNEFKIYKSPKDNCEAFNEQSWHFFSPEDDTVLRCIDK